jgi:hypothetical protein
MKSSKIQSITLLITLFVLAVSFEARAEPKEKSSSIQDKEVKVMSTLTVEKMRSSCLKAMELLSQAETARLRPEEVNLIEVEKQMKLAENNKKEGQEVDVAFKKFGDLVQRSDKKKHWIYLQAVWCYSELCKKSLKLRMLSIISQDWASADGHEARKKLKSDCESLREFIWEEHVENRQKIDIACQLLQNFQFEDSVENRKKLSAACEAITEGCLAIVKSGIFIPKEYQITD